MEHPARLTWQELREKEVLCICDGKRMGYPCDLEIDAVTGRICALLLPGDDPLFSFKKKTAFRVPFDEICRIGEDLILVNSCQRLPDGCSSPGAGHRKPCPSRGDRGKGEM